MKKKPTVTIGIPAYNEEANIGKLLKILLKQKQLNYKLMKIIVVSDGSIDKTDKIVCSINNPKIRLFKNKRRIGQPDTQNVITKKVDTDLLILINADVLPKGNLFIEKLIHPFLYDNNIGIVGADTSSAHRKSYFESIVIQGRKFKKNVYLKINNGSSVYLCHGRGRAFSKELYKNIRWVDDCPEDAFSYFYCLTRGLKFIYSKEAVVLFRSPTNVEGHKKQSDRFYVGKKNLEKYFDTKLIKKEYYLPKTLIISEFMKETFKYPLKMFAYFSVIVYLGISRIFTRLSINKTNYSLWNVTLSSKKI